jgi:Holliday junction resolvasome RuvABC endonuclease subunit
VHRADGRIESGVASFQPKANEGEGQRYVRFRRWLVEMKQTHDVDRIVYEKVMGHGAFQVIAAHVYGGLLATLQAFGEHHQIAYDGFAVTTIKKRWTGSGKADKAMMVNQCKALGFTPKDHNEADAIALLHVALDRCPVLTPSPTAKAAKSLKTAGGLPAQPF